MNNKNYFLHSVTAQLQSIKSILLYVLPGHSREAWEIISKYEDIAEEIAGAIAEINDEGGDSIE